MKERIQPRCPWCEETEYRCGAEVSEELYKECEFKTLKKDKSEIVKRMKKVFEEIEECKESIKKSKDKEEQGRLVGKILDKTFGIEKMMNCLEKEFGMSRKEYLKEIGKEGWTFKDKMNALITLKKLRRGLK